MRCLSGLAFFCASGLIALAACNETTVVVNGGTGGTGGGTAGTGGTGGSGGTGGTAGDGGSAGSGGEDGSGGTSGSGGSAGSAGSGGVGGIGGAGGIGGTGGTGGTLSACSTGPLATTGETDSGALTCTATLEFDLTVSLNATPLNGVEAGANEFDLQLEVAIDADTVDEVLMLAPGVVAHVNTVNGTVDATLGDTGPTPSEIVNEGVPCALAFEEGSAAVVVTTVERGAWTLDDGDTLELTLESLAYEIVLLGIPLTLTTVGDQPTCEFVGAKPSVRFSLP